MITCWKCNKQIEFSDKEIRYCPECGAWLKQSCPYCGKEISVHEEICPFCKRLFARCKKCRILYSLDTKDCSECEQKTIFSYDSFQSIGVNKNKENFLRPIIKIECKNKKPIHMNTAISRAIIFNDNLLFWMAQDNSCRLVCMNVTDENNLWEYNRADINIALRDIKFIEICEAYLITYLHNRILINILSDGHLVADIPIYTEYSAMLYDNKLYIQYYSTGIQKIDYYEVPYDKAVTISEESLDSPVSPMAWPVGYNGSIYFPNFSRGISRLQLDSKNYDVIFNAHYNCEIAYMAVHNQYLLFTKSFSGGKQSIARINLQDTMASVTELTAPLRLSTPLFTAYKDHIYVCEDRDPNTAFIEYPITGLIKSEGEQRNANVRDLKEFYTIEENGKLKFIYRGRSLINNICNIMLLNFNDENYKSIKSILEREKVQLVNMYDKTIMVKMDEGVIEIL